MIRRATRLPGSFWRSPKVYDSPPSIGWSIVSKSRAGIAKAINDTADEANGLTTAKACVESHNAALASILAHASSRYADGLREAEELAETACHVIAHKCDEIAAVLGAGGDDMERTVQVNRACGNVARECAEAVTAALRAEAGSA